MANLQDKIAEQPQPTGGGMRRVVSDGSESIAELKDFMGQMRGKSPRDVLGAVTSSSLVRSTLVAAVGFVVVLIGTSAAVHYWKNAFPDESKKPANVATPVADQQPPEEDAGSPPTVGDGAAEIPAQPSQAVVEPSGDPTLDNLGIGDTKQADPRKNPLEDSLDNLLDGAN